MKEECKVLILFVVFIGLLTLIGAYLTYQFYYWYENPEAYIHYLENDPFNTYPLFPTPQTPEEARFCLIFSYVTPLIIFIALLLYLFINQKEKMRELN